jgi:DNA-binding NarL/FixJ family response regulator
MLAAPAFRTTRREQVATLLAEAEAAFRGLGATAAEQAAREILRKSGLMSPARRRRTVPARQYAIGGLTARERDVLELLVAGNSNREIAAALFIAESTAELHVSRVLGKLGYSTRAQAAVYAVSLGWCASPSAELATA